MACCGEPLTGDPRAFARVHWSRLINGDDVQCVFENAWDQPLLPTRHEELANPMYARSAQEWFNKLPDDTAKSIVNLRRSMLNVYKKQTTPLARPRAYQPLPSPPDANAYDQALAGHNPLYPDPSILAQHQQQLFDQAQGEAPYPFYQAGQQLANILPWSKKPQHAAQRPAAGVLPLSPDGPVGTGYPLYPLPPPGHPMLPPGGLAMASVMGPDGKPLQVMYGPDGRPLPNQFGPDGRPLVGVPIDDPSVPDEPDARRWYEEAGPFAGFDYQWQRIDAQLARKQEEDAKQALLEQQQQMLQQQQQQGFMAQQQMMMGGLYPGGYPQGFRPPLMGQGPTGPYPLNQSAGGAFGMAPGMMGAMTPGASMAGLMPPPGMQGPGAMGAYPGGPGVPGGLLMQTAAQMPPGALLAQSMSMAQNSMGGQAPAGMLRQSGAFAPGLGGSMALQGGMMMPPPSPGGMAGQQLQVRHSGLAGSMAFAPGALGALGAGAPGDLRTSYPSRLPPQGNQYGQSMPGAGGQPGQQQQQQQQQLQGRLSQPGQLQQPPALQQQGQMGRTGPPQQAQFIGVDAPGQGQVQGQPGQGQGVPPSLVRQGAIPRTGAEQEAAAAAGQGAMGTSTTSASTLGTGAAGGQAPPPLLSRQGAIARNGPGQQEAAAAGQAAATNAAATAAAGGSLPAPTLGLQRSGQISRTGVDHDAAVQAGKAALAPDSPAKIGAGGKAGTGAGGKAAGDGKDEEDDYSAASRSAIKGQAATTATAAATKPSSSTLGKLPTLGGDKASVKASGAATSGGLKPDPRAPGVDSDGKAGGVVKPTKLPSTGDDKDKGKGRFGLDAEDDDEEAPIFSKASAASTKPASSTSTTTGAKAPPGVRPGTPVKGSLLAGAKPAAGLASKPSKGSAGGLGDYTIDEVDVEDEAF